MGQLDGRVAIVTAGGAGIGQGTVWLFAERGASVVAVDIDEAGLAETLARAACPERIRTVVADVTDESATQRVTKAAMEAFGALHLLINVVGWSRPGYTVVDLSLAEWNRYLAVNLTSTFLMSRAAIPRMVESGGGAIVNISSGAGITGMNRNAAYVAAKGGVIALTRALALDHGDQGVRVNCIAPGAILTPLMRRNRTPEEIEFMARRSLVGRLGDPRDIAATAAFLCSEDGAYVNGEVITVSGGMRTAV
jgi:NAD(P)-dependent dehydrogenase (short-subunit alcohol dehydrogenase family)